METYRRFEIGGEAGGSDSLRPDRLTVGSDSTELAALRAAVDAYVAWVGHGCRIHVARVAQALDELRSELDRADRLVAEQQDRIAPLYQLFPDWDDQQT